MNKVKVTFDPGVPDVLKSKRRQYYCNVCNKHIMHFQRAWYVQSHPYYVDQQLYGKMLTCSEECVNILVLQHIDEKPISDSYSYMAKTIQEAIDRQIIKDLKTLAEKSK